MHLIFVLHPNQRIFFHRRAINYRTVVDWDLLGGSRAVLGNHSKKLFMFTFADVVLPNQNIPERRDNWVYAAKTLPHCGCAECDVLRASKRHSANEEVFQLEMTMYVMAGYNMGEHRRIL